MKQETYKKFLQIVQAGVQCRLDTIHPPSKWKDDDPLRSAAENFVRATIQRLLEDDAVDAVGRASEGLDPDVSQALQAELEYFNLRFSAAKDFDPEKAGTVKESLEGVLNLPSWVDKLLKVLNELLKLISGQG